MSSAAAAAAAAAPAPPALEGVCEKHKRRTSILPVLWNTRYFRVDAAAGALLYYRSAAGTGEPAGRVPLAELLGARLTHAPRCVRLEARARDFLLRFGDEAAARAWADGLAGCAARRRVRRRVRRPTAALACAGTSQRAMQRRLQRQRRRRPWQSLGGRSRRPRPRRRSRRRRARISTGAAAHGGPTPRARAPRRRARRRWVVARGARPRRCRARCRSGVRPPGASTRSWSTRPWRRSTVVVVLVAALVMGVAAARAAAAAEAASAATTVAPQRRCKQGRPRRVAADGPAEVIAVLIYSWYARAVMLYAAVCPCAPRA